MKRKLLRPYHEMNSQNPSCFARFDSSFRKYHIRKVKIYQSFISHSCENKWKALCSGMLCSMLCLRYHRKVNIYQPFLSYSCENKWKALFMCSVVCYAQRLVSDIIEKWKLINRLYLILVRTNERHCSCAVVCYAQWAECLLLHEWYQDNRPTVWMGKCIYIFWMEFVAYNKTFNCPPEWYQDSRPTV